MSDLDIIMLSIIIYSVTLGLVLGLTFALTATVTAIIEEKDESERVDID